MVEPSGDMDASTRSLGPPLDQPPRSDTAPNVNPPVGSVGPNVPVAGEPSAQGGAEGGFGSTHVMYDQAFPPLEAQAWAGWPVQWDAPNTNSLGANMGGLWGADLDVIWMAADLNARTLADLPCYPAKEDGTLVAKPSWLRNPQPTVYRAGWIEFVRQVAWSYWVAGEVFIVATSRFADGSPRTFMMVNPMFVQVDLIHGVAEYRINGVDATDDMLHIKYQGWPDDAHGHGPLDVAGLRITAARALMRYGSDLAVNGGIPWAVLTHKYRLTQTQADALRAQWISAARKRSGAPVILDQDMSLTPLMVSPKDMALSEMQGFTEARLSVLMGVPPFLLSLPSGETSMTYQNVGLIFEQHWRQGLKPAAGEIYAALSEWALPLGTDLIVNAESYIRPGLTERVAAYQGLFDMGAITVNEIRRNERLEPVDGGDTLPKKQPIPPALAAAAAPTSTPKEGTGDDPAAGFA